ncbi:MAG: ACT domain-containing protein [Acidimicrobiales bacterium]
MPDRPGMLAQVTQALATIDADIATVEIIERISGVVVDEFTLTTPAMDPIALARELEAVPGVVVESVRTVEEQPSSIALLELAAELSAHPGDRLTTLVAGVPRAIRAAWCLAVSGDYRGGTRVLDMSQGAPRITSEHLPWLPLEKPRRLAAAGWMPTSWRMRAALGGLELAAWPLGGPSVALLVGRYSGLRFRAPELRQVELLIDMAAGHGPVTLDLSTRTLTEA